jgi:hypothetical protein
MRKDYRVAFWAFIIALSIGGVLAVDLANEKTQTHKVLSIDMVKETQGDSDGFYTTVYYQVSTDKGAYRIEMSGINAAPECAGIKKDSTYTMTTRGISFPFLGIYPNIIKVR